MANVKSEVVTLEGVDYSKKSFDTVLDYVDAVQSPTWEGFTKWVEDRNKKAEARRHALALTHASATANALEALLKGLAGGKKLSTDSPEIIAAAAALKMVGRLE